MSQDPPLWPRPLPPRPVDIVGIGETSLDQLAVVDAFPRGGAKVAALEVVERAGGQVATALLACARLGLRASLITSVGDDPAGQRALAPLRKAHLDLSGIRLVPGAATRTAVILVDRRTGDRTVIWHRDPRLHLKVDQLSRAQVKQGRVLLLDALDPDVAIWAAGVAREAGVPVILDADTVVPGIRELLERVDFPIVGRAFAEELFGTRSPAEALQGLAASGARFPVVTLGEKGAIGGGPCRMIESPAFDVPVRDTTGAGDVFHAAFAWGLLQGLGEAATLRVANAAASLSCRALGAQGALPGRQELEDFLREHA